MDKEKFDAVFPIIVAALTNRIAAENRISDEKAIAEFYTSQLYSVLENEQTKVWQYSTEKLYDLYRKEKENGSLELPEY
ncbi:hypothetical protein ACRQU7_01600 [Caproiciproducens sp. R1]|uniref:hypothetical protein n=1 Tax=Caproiciproducens sp. R1 TaxID=3435000 RepID=UPI004033F03B